MKKHFVYGYGNDKYTVKEKYTAVFLVGMCIAAALITFLVVVVSKNINKNNTSDILIESGSDKNVKVIETEEVNILSGSNSKEAMSEKTVVDNTETEPIEEMSSEELTYDKNKSSNSDELKDAETYIKPCNGEIIYEFSPDFPVFSPTLKDWRVHNGVDLKAFLGEEVLAIGSGIVESVYEDARFGNTIVILHPGNTKSVYSNLENSIVLNNGDKIEKGSVIARVGDTALFETIAETHLHFELIVNGSYVNPEDYLNLK